MQNHLRRKKKWKEKWRLSNWRRNSYLVRRSEDEDEDDRDFCGWKECFWESLDGVEMLIRERDVERNENRGKAEEARVWKSRIRDVRLFFFREEIQISNDEKACHTASDRTVGE